MPLLPRRCGRRPAHRPLQLRRLAQIRAPRMPRGVEARPLSGGPAALQRVQREVDDEAAAARGASFRARREDGAAVRRRRATSRTRPRCGPPAVGRRAHRPGAAPAWPAEALQGDDAILTWATDANAAAARAREAAEAPAPAPAPSVEDAAAGWAAEAGRAADARRPSYGGAAATATTAAAPVAAVARAARPRPPPARRAAAAANARPGRRRWHRSW